MKTAVFPGSFDPITSGHEAIVRRALLLFDKIYIAVGVNSEKHYMFGLEDRVQKIRQMFADTNAVEVVTYSDMTVDLCRRMNARFILRGIRNAEDLAYEQTIAAVNQTLAPEIETVILLADMAHRDISSTIERERLSHQSNA